MIPLLPYKEEIDKQSIYVRMKERIFCAQYAQSEFTPCLDDALLDAEDIIASAGDTEITIREAAGHNSVTGSQGYKSSLLCKNK
ncbi:hypothetical protein V9T40_013276 [Parthenolecanium corni]|uniref:Uncharacterized protein n=1 Tax=Parthenolecanium corni TaxID=536013 RepID=A0AAN9TN81_9HEMI